MSFSTVLCKYFALRSKFRNAVINVVYYVSVIGRYQRDGSCLEGELGICLK